MQIFAVAIVLGNVKVLNKFTDAMHFLLLNFPSSCKFFILNSHVNVFSIQLMHSVTVHVTCSCCRSSRNLGKLYYFCHWQWRLDCGNCEDFHFQLLQATRFSSNKSDKKKNFSWRGKKKFNLILKNFCCCLSCATSEDVKTNKRTKVEMKTMKKVSF